MAADESHDDKTQSFVALTKGTKVSHYNIIEKIGAGGMGEVYLALDTKLDREVALKFLPHHLCQDEDYRARFKREAQAAAKLDHPNIVPIFEVGEFQSRPFYSMAHIEGTSLRDIIKQGGLSVSDAIRLTIQILEGLHKAHESGVVHRDMKPGNVIIDKENRPRILDFGLAMVVGVDKLTKTGSMLGTVGYMSPEQVTGKKADHRSDIFSVGVVLYEMLTGHRPFKGDNDIAVSRSITDTTPDPVSRHISNAPDSIQQIIDRALAKDPSLRYQHADDFCADVKRLQSGVYVDSARPARIMIAILPFENLGPTEDEYFADGVTDEIMAKLAAIRELGVIARTSSVQYKGTDKPIRQIADELGVDYILEGTIRWQKRLDKPDLVRITPQLIQASDATHLWAENFDRELSEIFEIQTDIANRTVEQLRITLLADEDDALGHKPTDNIEAYNYYLHGNYFRSMPDETRQSTSHAIEMYVKAVECDPLFVEARALLAGAYLFHYYQWDRSDKYLQLGKEQLDRALEISQDTASIYRVLSSYYSLIHDSDKRLEALLRLRELAPNSVETNFGFANFWWNRGRFDEAIELYKKACNTDPRNFKLAWNLAWKLTAMRRYEEADRVYRLSKSIAPDQEGMIDHLAWHVYLWKGETQAALAILSRMPRNSEYYDMVPYAQVRIKMCEREYADALAILNEAPDRMCTHRWDHQYRSPKSFLVGLVYWIKGDYQSARESFNTSIEILENDSKQDGVSARNLSSLGIAYAGIGRKSDAVEKGKQAVDAVPIATDPNFGVLPIFDLILIYTMVGEYDLALDRVEQLLIYPCDEFSTVTMRIDPIWDPLRDHPRFQALIDKYGKEHRT